MKIFTVDHTLVERSCEVGLLTGLPHDLLNLQLVETARAESVVILSLKLLGAVKSQPPMQAAFTVGQG